MFDNIGNKIKDLAIFVCWIGIGVSVVIGMILLAMGGSAADSRYTEDAAPGFYIAGIAVAVVGSLLSWVGSFFMYGFGELVQNSIEVRQLIAEGSGQSVASKLKDVQPIAKVPAEDYNNKSYNEKLLQINNMRRAGQLTEEEYNRAVNNLRKQ